MKIQGWIMAQARSAKFVTDEQFVLNVAVEAGDAALSGRSKFTGEKRKARMRARKAFETVVNIWSKTKIPTGVARALAEKDKNLVKCHRLGIDEMVKASLEAEQQGGSYTTTRGKVTSVKKVSLRVDTETHAPLQKSSETSTGQEPAAGSHAGPGQTISQVVSLAVDTEVLHQSKHKKETVSSTKQKETDFNVLLAAWKARSPGVSISALSELLEMLHRYKPALDYSKLATSGRQVIQVGDE